MLSHRSILECMKYTRSIWDSRKYSSSEHFDNYLVQCYACEKKPSGNFKIVWCFSMTQEGGGGGKGGGGGPERANHNINKIMIIY